LLRAARLGSTAAPANDPIAANRQVYFAGPGSASRDSSPMSFQTRWSGHR
jgi:hypothetical protein